MTELTAVPNPPALYRHYKGDIYRLVTKGIHADTTEPMIAYENIDPEKPGVYFHHIMDFFALVEWEGEKVQRFKPYAGAFPGEAFKKPLNCS